MPKPPDRAQMTARQQDIADRGADALHAAMHEDYRGAAAILSRLHEDHPRDGIGIAVLVWCDIVGAHLGFAPEHTGEPIMPMFWDIEQERAVAIGDVGNPGLIWAMRLITARLARDMDGYNALARVVPQDEYRERLADLLTCCVSTLKHIPPGATVQVPL